MSDIVERLQFEYGFGDRLEAAEEILHLRAENEKLRAKLMAATGELCDRAAAAALKGNNES